MYAIYDRNVTLLWWLCVLLVVQVAAELAVIEPVVLHMKSKLPLAASADLPDHSRPVHPLPPGLELPGCIPDHVSTTQWTYWISGFFFEFFLLLKCF